MSSLAVWRSRRSPSLFAALALVAVVAACDSSTSDGGDIASVAVNPPTPTLNVGQSTQLVATPTTSGGRIVDRAVTWTTSNMAVATVDANGLVTGVAGGTAEITATAGGESGVATVNVWFPVQSITLASAGGVTTIKQEASLQLTPTITDASGAVVTGRQLLWTSSNNAIAEVSTAGRIVGRTDGVATITATAMGGGASATFDVTISGPPDVATVTLASALGIFMAPGMEATVVATARAASGTVLSLTGRTVVWSSSDEAVATVTDGVTGGVVSMLTEGETDISVTVDGIAATADLTFEGFPEAVVGAEDVQPTIPQGESIFYVIDVPASTASLVIALGGDEGAGSDADIYLYGLTGSLLAQSFNSGTAETITRTSPPAGRYLLEINSWEDAGGASVNAKLNITITPVAP